MEYPEKSDPSLSWEALDRRLGDQDPFLLSLEDGPDNLLRLVVAGAALGPSEDSPETGLPALDEILQKAVPILPGETRWEIVFEDYILYRTRSESYCSYEPGETGAGKYLRILEKSRLLEELPEITLAQKLPDGSCFPGPWRHYRIYTQNHITDVVTSVPPKIRRLPPVE
jgi:hypothetical protein